MIPANLSVCLAALQGGKADAYPTLYPEHFSIGKACPEWYNRFCCTPRAGNEGPRDQNA